MKYRYSAIAAIFVVATAPFIYVHAGAIGKATAALTNIIKEGMENIHPGQLLDDAERIFVNSKNAIWPDYKKTPQTTDELLDKGAETEIVNQAKEGISLISSATETLPKNATLPTVSVKDSTADTTSMLANGPTRKTPAQKPSSIGKVKKSPPKPTSFPVTVRTTPSHANVRIMNIAPKYQDGMKLKPGKYDVEVTATGYRTQRAWIPFDQEYDTLEVVLNKKGSLACEGFEIVEGGSPYQPYGSQILIEDELENVTLTEVYLSLMDYLDSRNYVTYYRTNISPQYAYIEFIYATAGKDVIYDNQKAEIKNGRFVRHFIGLEHIPNTRDLKIITFIEIQQGAFPYDIENAYCKIVEAL